MASKKHRRRLRSAHVLIENGTAISEISRLLGFSTWKLETMQRTHSSRKSRKPRYTADLRYRSRPETCSYKEDGFDYMTYRKGPDYKNFASK